MCTRPVATPAPDEVVSDPGALAPRSLTGSQRALVAGAGRVGS